MAKKTVETMKEIRKLNDEELAIEINDARRRQFDLRSQAVTEKIEDTSQFSAIRRKIARLLTERTQRNNKQTAQA